MKARRVRGIAILAVTSLAVGSAVSVVSPAGAQEPKVEEQLRALVMKGDAEEAAGFLLELRKADPGTADAALGPIVSLAAEEFKAHHRAVGIGMLEAAKKAFPEEPKIYLVLGQFYWYAEDRPRCIEAFTTVLRIDPENVTGRRFRDLLFFVPDGFEVPDTLITGSFRIRPLTPADVDLDYQAVMSSIDHLRGVFGPDDDWPSEELTREEDLRALENHQREHRQRSAFTYTVLDRRESEVLGCIYILPVHTDAYDAQIFFWVTQVAFDAGLDGQLYAVIKRWIAEDWPFERVVYPGRDIDWEAYDALVETG